MKKWVWLTGGLLVCTGFVIGIVFWKIQKEVKKDDPEYIVQFMREN